RTALLAWLHTRSGGGRFVMRVEDLDAGRVRPGVMEAQLQELQWLGLDWDEGPDVGGRHAPYLQTQRMERYQEALRTLASAGRLFRCDCSRRDLARAASAPHEGEEGPRYPGSCRERIAAPEEMDGREGMALRFRVEPGVISFADLIHGKVALDPDHGGDFVVRRRDGVAAYQLAVVVDDAAMEITHVVRGADLLPSTPRQLLLYRALGLAEPAWAHVPLAYGADGSRLAKRHGAVSLAELRAAGVRPERVVGWMASSLGIGDAGAEASAASLVERFDLSRITREASYLTEGTLREILAT
ncbi:MAG: tRNA glutamyl-Q(34) synthetase GluQRS, partial [Gemmatimonadota bacterium]|nr:tRNA glutamyl-Q(34) synthetase GluQRS [Gemmatimonadota bacterium]